MASTGSQDQDEAKFGINAYSTSTKGFFGVLKHRYTDFVVRECSLDGDVARLTTTDGTMVEEAAFPKAEKLEMSNDDAISAFFAELAVLTAEVNPSESVGADSIALNERLKTYFQACINKETDVEPSVVGMACCEKEMRGKVHGLVRKYMGKSIDSGTDTIDGVTYMVFKAKHSMKGFNPNKADSGGGRGDGHNSRRDGWPKNVGDFLEFTMIKMNVDTLKATQSMAQGGLRCKDTSITYAGTKDKRAVTVQRCCVYRRKPSDFKGINKKGMVRGALVRVGDFKYSSKAMRLGDLSGNRFSLVLRDVQESSDLVEAACEQLKSNGFLNYFGLQRFGRGGESSSSAVGVEYIKGNVPGALALLLGIKLSEDKAELFTSIDLQEAARKFGMQYFSNESKAVDCLQRFPQDGDRALKCIPRSTRLMCAHAYQSLLFNEALTERINKYGLSPVVGDLISLKERDESMKDTKVFRVTQEDVDNNKYTMADVVLPLVGHDAQLPSNDIGDMYSRRMSEDGISLEFFKTKAAPEFRMTGAYRRIIEYPKDFQWRQLDYSDPDEELVETELGAHEVAAREEWQKVQDKKAAHEAAKNADDDEADMPDDIAEMMEVAKEGDKKALRAVQLEFTLAPGTYATMLIRELSKQSTSPAHYQSIMQGNTAKVDEEPALKKAKH
jgi:tRNA pseudouridine13 synthase